MECEVGQALPVTLILLLTLTLPSGHAERGEELHCEARFKWEAHGDWNYRARVRAVVQVMVGVRVIAIGLGLRLESGGVTPYCYPFEFRDGQSLSLIG